MNPTTTELKVSTADMVVGDGFTMYVDLALPRWKRWLNKIGFTFRAKVKLQKFTVSEVLDGTTLEINPLVL